MSYQIKGSPEIHAAYTCAQLGEWGPYHVMIPGPQTGENRWGPTRDRSKDKTLCGIKLTKWWERDCVEPHRIQCKRCQATLEKKMGKQSRLLPKYVQDKIPALYTQENKDDPVVACKFFASRSNWTWFVIEGEEQDDGDWLFFGLVFGFEEELGYFTLRELESAVGPFGPMVERDKHFKPKPLSEVWDRWPFEEVTDG